MLNGYFIVLGGGKDQLSLIKNIKKWNKNTLEENLKGLYNSVIKFQGEAEQADDITILGFEYLEPVLNEIIFSKILTIK